MKASASSEVPGALFLIPVPLGCNDPSLDLPAGTLAAVRRISHFVVENAKTARAHLRAFAHPQTIQSIALVELDGNDSEAPAAAALAWLRAGHDVGLMSEAGCPAVADPGAELVARAHQQGIAVRPLVGPSSILLALMASGLGGQRFAFHGYLPVRTERRIATLRDLETRSCRDDSVQLFIETPYRNQAMLASIVDVCRPETRLCLASRLGHSDEWIRCTTIAEWRLAPLPTIDRRPTVFLLKASAGRR